MARETVVRRHEDQLVNLQVVHADLRERLVVHERPLRLRQLTFLVQWLRLEEVGRDGHAQDRVSEELETAVRESMRGDFACDLVVGERAVVRQCALQVGRVVKVNANALLEVL